MDIKHPARLWLAALAVAWIFDQLFWTQNPGINFFLFVTLTLAAGLLLAWGERLRLARASLALLVPILACAALTFIRQEPMTTFINVVLVLTGLVVLALTLRSGDWPLYSLADGVVGFLRLAFGALAHPIEFFTAALRLQKASPAEAAGSDSPAEGSPVQDSTIPRPAQPRLWPAIVRGLVLAVPVVAVLAGLLSAADPAFARVLHGMLFWFDINKLGEYILRAVYIAVLGYLLLGVYLHGLFKSAERKLIGLEKPWLAPFLGWTEAVIVLAAVDLLFVLFVAVQFSYFFGGQANIKIDGFTYADYYRRGFFELVTVACISLLLFLGLSSITRRQAPRQGRIFSGLGIGLLALVTVILVSAYQRLMLYESAYGFSRLRAYTHVFIIWLGVLLAATVLLELLRRQRAFALAAVLVSLGFGLTLDALNVDAFIATRNVQIARVNPQGRPLDHAYLVTLSDDAVPALGNLFLSGGLPGKVHDEVGASLACKAFLAGSNDQPKAWPSFHLSAYTARQWYTALAPALRVYRVSTNPNNSEVDVMVNGAQVPCLTFQGMD